MLFRLKLTLLVLGVLATRAAAVAHRYRRAVGHVEGEVDLEEEVGPDDVVGESKLDGSVSDAEWFYTRMLRAKGVHVKQASNNCTAAQVESWVAARNATGLCVGSSCAIMSNFLPQLRFKRQHCLRQNVTCTCPQFFAGQCFAPGCFPCNLTCFGCNQALIQNAGPFGTGLLCSSGCNPCCSFQGNTLCQLTANCFA